MPYVTPQALVFQDLTASAAAQETPLRAHISGGHAQLVRYAVDAERPIGSLGFYDSATDTDHAWPGRVVGGVVDHSYTKLFVKDALLQYANNLDGNKIAGSRNRVRLNANVANSPAAANNIGNDRGAVIGDVVKATFGSVTVWSYVAGLIAEVGSTVVAAAAADASNPIAATNAITVSQVHGPWNAITAAVSGTYSPYATGVITETYTVIVTQASTGGDLRTARLRVLSSSGLDNQTSVTPTAENTFFGIGTHGVTMKFTSGHDANQSADSLSAEAQQISYNDLLVGMRFTVVATGTYAVPVATSSGTYTGSVTDTYLIEVVEGGLYANSTPKIQVSTTNGLDISGPTPVHAAATPVVVGTKGVRVAFSGTGLARGTKWTIKANAATVGALRTIVLGHNIPTTVADTAAVTVALFIKKDVVELPQNRVNEAPLVNFVQTDTQITIASNLDATDDSYTVSGDVTALPIISESTQGYGELFVEYRAWRPELSFNVHAIDAVGDLDTIEGALDPDNPLKWAIFKALENANGSTVKFTAVADPESADSWVKVIDLLEGQRDTYGLVPLTRDGTVIDLFLAHVNQDSSAEKAQWRSLWVNLNGVPTFPLVSAGSTVPGYTEATTVGGAVCLATITDNDQASGTQYTLVRNDDSSGQFVTNGVRAGDKVRALYTGDGFGGLTWTEFTVDAVVTENELRLVSGPSAPVNTPAKIEIWRNPTTQEEATAIATTAGAYGSRRVRAVWPDRIESSGTVMEGYFLCASLAALRGGLPPHQGITNMSVEGYTSVSRTTDKFNRSQLDIMAGSGVWIVTQDKNTANGLGLIYSRHALTTAAYDDIDQREEMHCANTDSISFRVMDTLSPFIGVANNVAATRALMDLELNTLGNVLKTEKFTSTLGGQVVDWGTSSIVPHPVLRDRVIVTITPVYPYPLNNAEAHLII